MTDSELILGCKKGNSACEYELFRRYGGKLFTVCRRYARHSMEAEDWLQDSFIRIFEKIDQYRGEGSFEGWMRRVTVHVILKKIKKSQYQNEQYPEEGLPEQGVSPDALMLLSEEEILNLISNLPDGYKIVFNLAAIEGYSHKEIGEMLGIQEVTSRSQLAKARKWLQREIVKNNSEKIRTA
jgi:RNA polymerase sigma-70 factor (ECF subfamily)